MKKSFVLILLLTILSLYLCSFVNPSSTDIFTGTIIFNESEYPVTHLSGSADFAFPDYSDFVLNDSGFLYNLGSSTKSGLMELNGNTYEVRFQSHDELQVRQTYTSSSSIRSTWVSYHLRADRLPSDLSFGDILFISLTVISIILGGLLILQKGVI